jgi:hypothetical protein
MFPPTQIPGATHDEELELDPYKGDRDDDFEGNDEE